MSKPKSSITSLPPELRGGSTLSSPSTKSDDSTGAAQGTPMKASPFTLPTKYKRFHALTAAKSPKRGVPRSVARRATSGGHIPVSIGRKVIGGL